MSRELEWLRTVHPANQQRVGGGGDRVQRYTQFQCYRPGDGDPDQAQKLWPIPSLRDVGISLRLPHSQLHGAQVHRDHLTFYCWDLIVRKTEEGYKLAS